MAKKLYLVRGSDLNIDGVHVPENGIVELDDDVAAKLGRRVELAPKPDKQAPDKQAPAGKEDA